MQAAGVPFQARGAGEPVTKGGCLEDIVSLRLEAQLCLSFLTYKVGITIVPTSEG